MQDLVVEVFELAGGLRRGVAAIANLAGQTQAGSHAMRIAATGRLGLAMIARRLGLARHTLRRIAEHSSPTAMPRTNPTPTSPLPIVTGRGKTVLVTINDKAAKASSRNATAWGQDGISELR